MADIPIAELDELDARVRAERRSTGLAEFLDSLDLLTKLGAAYPALSEEVRRHRGEIERLRRQTEATIAAAASDRKELVLAQARIAALEGAVRSQAA